jgi:hypothetical protein
MATATFLGTLNFKSYDPWASLPSGAKVILISSGQSNWHGVNQLSPPTLPTLSFSKWWNPYANSNSGGFTSVVPGSGYREPPNPSIYLAKAIEDAYPNIVLHLIESGQGATGFENGSGGFAAGGNARNDLIFTINSALDALDAAQQPYYFLGFVWNQGEADASSLVNANAWALQMSELLSEIKGLTVPSLPLLTVRLNDATQYIHKSIIRASQQLVSTDWIDTDSIAMAPDKIHYTSDGYEAIGIAQFNKVKKIPPILATPPPPSSSDTLFSNITILPDGWTLVSAQANFQSDRTVIIGNGGLGWGLRYLIGPEISSYNSIEIEVIGTGQLGAVGISTNPETWLDGGPGQSMMIATGGGVFKNTEGIGDIGQWINNAPMRFKFSKDGANTRIMAYSGNTLISSLLAQGQVLSPKVVVDAAYGQIPITKVRVVD